MKGNSGYGWILTDEAGWKKYYTPLYIPMVRQSATMDDLTNVYTYIISVIACKQESLRRVIVSEFQMIKVLEMVR